MLGSAQAIAQGQQFAQWLWQDYTHLKSAAASGRVSLISRLGARWRDGLSPAEQAWIDRIERRRAELNAAPDEIRFVDYGAGVAGQERSPTEMAQGVERVEILGRISQRASKSPFWDLLLFKLLRILQPQSCLEMGACVGLSAAYQGAALSCNGAGNLVTIEGGAALAAVAEATLTGLELDTSVQVVVGRFADRLPEVLERQAPIDYAFIDGHHEEKATWAYFEQLLPYLAQPALLVFDDINWSEGMKRVWAEIAADRRVGVAIDVGALGLVWIDPELPLHTSLSWPLL